ncbi:3-phosphoshikimate 1-carboxyvinyltransferase [Thermodesulfobacteriota bacterium]
MKQITPKNNIDSTVTIPGSKSLTHRALIAASLADGKSCLKSFLACEDTLYTVDALKKMGVNIDLKDDIALVHGNSGLFIKDYNKVEIDLGNSGTSYRLLLSTAAIAEGLFYFTGSERLKERPVEYLVNALRSLDVEITHTEKDGYPPVLINASGIKGGNVKIPGDISSQYISSLLLSGPYTKSGLEIEVSGNLVSQPYIDLTLDVMSAFGIDVKHDKYKRFNVPAGRIYQAREYVIDGDVSSASYFWGAAAVMGGAIKTENIRPLKTRQGDIGFLNILEKMGCDVVRGDSFVMVKGGPLTGISVDMGSMPDMVPTLAVIALFAKGKTVIHNVSHLKHKESDRIADTARELRNIGARVEELEDGLVIYGGENLTGGEIDPHNDHRLAMSFAIAGLKVPEIVIRDESCVNKSFPTFWNLWAEL